MSPFLNHENIGEVQKTAYLTATVVSIDSEDDTMEFTGIEPCPDATDCPIFYHCTNESEQRSNGALEGAAGAFSKDDVVIVQCEVVDSTTYEPLYVIGFADERPRHCGEYLVIHLYNPLPYNKVIIWDVVLNSYATDIIGDDEDPVTTWPAERSNLDTWFEDHPSSQQDELLSMESQLGEEYEEAPFRWAQCGYCGCNFDVEDIKMVDLPGLGLRENKSTMVGACWCNEEETTRTGVNNTSYKRHVVNKSNHMYTTFPFGHRRVSHIFGSWHCTIRNDSVGDDSCIITIGNIPDEAENFHAVSVPPFYSWVVTGILEWTIETPYGIMGTINLPYSSIDDGSSYYVTDAKKLYDSINVKYARYTDRSMAVLLCYIYGTELLNWNAHAGGGYMYWVYSDPYGGSAPQLGWPTQSSVQYGVITYTHQKPQFMIQAVCCTDGDPEHKNPFDLPRNPQLETAMGVMVQQFIDQACDAGLFDAVEFPPISLVPEFRR